MCRPTHLRNDARTHRFGLARALTPRMGSWVLSLLLIFGVPGCGDTASGRPHDTGSSADTRGDLAGDTAQDTKLPDSSNDGAGNDTAVDADTTDTPSADTSADTKSDIPTGPGPVVSLAIEPPTSVIYVIGGVGIPVHFSARATYADGSTASVQAAWSWSRFELASVGADGVLTPSGDLGGEGTLTARAFSQEAHAQVRIILRETRNEAGLTQDVIAAFENPDATASGALIYPYDQTVFARGILAPEIMWDGGSAGDRYRVRLTQEFMEVTSYVAIDPPCIFTMPEEVWVKLTETNGGEPVQVDVMRLDGAGQAHLSMDQTWHVAQGSLRGTIYYWAVNRGRPMKITPGAAAPQPVFDAGLSSELGSPAPADYDGTVPPWTTGSNGERCASCHTVSRNGNRMATVFENKGSAPSPWAVIDLTTQPPVTTWVSSYLDRVLFVALSPDGHYGVPNSTDFRFELVDTTTGSVLPSLFDAYPENVADGAFSPDGRHFAFSADVTGAYPVEFWRADLDVVDFDPSTETFANPRELVAAGNEAIAFPSFTPDSAWVIYQRGTYSRANYGGNLWGIDDLFMADLAGSVGELRLDAANGSALQPHNQHINYEPRVNPIAVGGYMWVVFVSPRDYGHRMRSVSNPSYENRKQLWVAAVDLNPQPGVDPSHPGFWLPGQDLATINMSGYWALDPCQGEGAFCEAGFECCSGFCQVNGATGQKVCVPPAGQCSEEGDACAAASDCCNPNHLCLGGFCSLNPN